MEGIAKGLFMDATTVGTRHRTRWVANLRAGLLVHFAAALVFIALSALRLEGCDTADGLAAAWTLAILADLFIAAVAVVLMRRANRHHLRAALVGWTLSFIPALVAAGIAIAYMNSLPSGCP
jgi:hypothetical protein